MFGKAKGCVENHSEVADCRIDSDLVGVYRLQSLGLRKYLWHPFRKTLHAPVSLRL